MFSDHVPIKFQLQINYQIEETTTEINKLWCSLKNEELVQAYKETLQTALSKVEE